MFLGDPVEVLRDLLNETKPRESLYRYAMKEELSHTMIAEIGIKECQGEEAIIKGSDDRGVSAKRSTSGEARSVLGCLRLFGDQLQTSPLSGPLQFHPVHARF